MDVRGCELLVIATAFRPGFAAERAAARRVQVDVGRGGGARLLAQQGLSASRLVFWSRLGCLFSRPFCLLLLVLFSFLH